MAERPLSLRQEQIRLSTSLRERHQSWALVAAEFRQRYGVNARVALRLAHGWSQRQVADLWNERWPAESKTFKNFSYWENWPGKTGYAPSLDVLGRLAELYECSVGDLLADYADFRHKDAMHSMSQQIAQVSSIVNTATIARSASGSVPDMATLTARLVEMDVHELARLGAGWAQELNGAFDRRALLLKLSVSLTLAAAMPAITTITASPKQATTMDAENDKLAGIWHSRYVYYSSGREAEFEDEHYVVLRRQKDGRLIGQSLPHSSDSQLNLDLSVDGSVATGTWLERTSPNGHYKGAVYHGTVQLLVDPMSRSMSGKWLGFGSNFTVNSGEWKLSWIEGSTSKRAMRDYYLKA